MVDRRLGAGLAKARKKTPPISDVDTLSMLVLPVKRQLLAGLDLATSKKCRKRESVKVQKAAADVPYEYCSFGTETEKL